MYCRRCGAALHQGVVICPECGARQRRGISSVRCARCGHRVSLGLTVCPHCGRDVHPAGPRWGLWLVGFAILALGALWGLDELPVEQVKTEVASVRTRVARVVQFLGPVGSGGGQAAPQAAATPRPTQVVAALPATATLAATKVVLPTATASPTVESTTVLTATIAAKESSTPAATPTFEPTATPSPTVPASPTPTATLTPTATPAPTATSAPASTGRVTYKVQSGDTLSSIADKFGIAWQDLATANGLTSKSTLRIGQELVIPGKGQAAPAPTSAPARPATSVKYTVKSGDTLSSIAAKYGITWQELAAANGLTSSSRLRVGQELTIPGQSTSQSAPTAAPVQATPRLPTSTPASVALLSAPQLISPGDGTPYSGNVAFYLEWARVDNMPSDARYQVTIQWTEGGEPNIHKVDPTTATTIQFPTWLFGRADQPVRKYSWSVRVVRITTDGKGGEKEILLSPASETRVLYWN